LIVNNLWHNFTLKDASDFMILEQPTIEKPANVTMFYKFDEGCDKVVRQDIINMLFKSFE